MKIKIMLFGLITISLITWIVAGYTGDSSSGDWISNPLVVNFDNFTIDGISSLFNTYFKLSTFSVEGMPFFITLIFSVINIITLYVIIVDLLLPLLRSNPWVLLVGVIASLIAVMVAWFGG